MDLLLQTTESDANMNATRALDTGLSLIGDKDQARKEDAEFSTCF